MAIENQFWNKLTPANMQLTKSEEAMFEELRNYESYVIIARHLAPDMLDAYLKHEHNAIRPQEVTKAKNYFLSYIAGIPFVILKLLKEHHPQCYVKTISGLQEKGLIPTEQQNET